MKQFKEMIKTQQAYLSSFPTPLKLKNELESLNFQGRFLREDREMSYDGDIRIKFDDSDKMCFFMKEGYEKYLSNSKSVGFSFREKFKLDVNEIENIEGFIQKFRNTVGGPCQVELHLPSGKCTWVIEKPDSFPKGTKFYIGFTNLQINSYSKFDIGSFRFNFRDTEDKFWEIAKNSIDGKITNVCKAETLKEAMLEELEEVLFSIEIFFEIITSNRIRNPIIKFILPNEKYGYLLYGQYSNVRSNNGLRVFYNHYSHGIQYPGFHQNAIKLTHEKKYCWNLFQFAEYLISYNYHNHIEKRMLFVILALETLVTGYLLDKIPTNLSEIKKMNIEQKIRKMNEELKCINFDYYGIKELSDHRNMLFHQGKLPNYDMDILKRTTTGLMFKWLELAWFIFLKIFNFQCVFNKPPIDEDQNFQLADYEKCRMQKCNFQNQCKKNSEY